MKRAVITGFGIISSIGNNKEEVLASLKAGKSGIEVVPEFIEMKMRSHVAGTIKLDPSEHIDRKVYRFMGDAAAYAYLSMREAIEGETGHPLVDVDYADVVDGAIVWWRADDAEEEDLADVLVDAMSNLDDGGLIWVLIPKPGRPNSVRVGDVEEAAEIAGLHATTSTALGGNWAGVRLTARPRSRR